MARDSHNPGRRGQQRRIDRAKPQTGWSPWRASAVCCDRSYHTTEMPPPVGGLMSDADLGTVIRQYDRTETAYPRTGLALLHSGRASSPSWLFR
ncbi:MAG: hypothetical protein ACLTZY_11045 [Alistipes indistinctus]